MGVLDDVLCNNDLFGMHKGETHYTQSLNPAFPGPRTKSLLRDAWNYWNAPTKIVAIRMLRDGDNSKGS